MSAYGRHEVERLWPYIVCGFVFVAAIFLSFSGAQSSQWLVIRTATHVYERGLGRDCLHVTSANSVASVCKNWGETPTPFNSLKELAVPSKALQSAQVLWCSALVLLLFLAFLTIVALYGATDSPIPLKKPMLYLATGTIMSQLTTVAIVFASKYEMMKHSNQMPVDYGTAFYEAGVCGCLLTLIAVVSLHRSVFVPAQHDDYDMARQLVRDEFYV